MDFQTTWFSSRMLLLVVICFSISSTLLPVECAPNNLPAAPVSRQYVRGCYYTNWAQYRPGKGKYMPENYIPGLCTHIFYAFAVMTQDFQIKPFEWNDESTAWSKGMYERVNDLKKLQPGLKVLLSFGGWTFSQGNLQLLSKLLASAENRRRFIDSSLAFVRKHNFDGLDLDFEYPSAGDKPNFVTFVKEMKAAFEEESKKTRNECLLLTAAVAAGFDKIDAGYDVPSLAKLFDLINVMTYDFHGAWEQVTGMNSPLHDTKGDRYAIIDAMDYWAKNGAPKEKLIVGFSAYGRGFTLRNEGSDQPIGSSTNGPAEALPFTREAGVGTYYEMCDFLENGAKRNQDDRTKVPYLIKGNQWFGYDDEWSFKIKLDWLKENGFGGAFTWALDMDDFSGLCKSSAGRKFPLHQLIADALVGGRNSASQANVTANATSDGTSSNGGASSNHYGASSENDAHSLAIEDDHDTTTTSTITQSDAQTSSPEPQATTTNATAGPTANGQQQQQQFRCPGSGIFLDPEKCERFYMCADAGGTPYLLTCPAGLLFDPRISACDWPRNVRCPGDSL